MPSAQYRFFSSQYMSWKLNIMWRIPEFHNPKSVLFIQCFIFAQIKEVGIAASLIPMYTRSKFQPFQFEEEVRYNAYS